jgi:phosphatidylserine synthase
MKQRDRLQTQAAAVYNILQMFLLRCTLISSLPVPRMKPADAADPFHSKYALCVAAVLPVTCPSTSADLSGHTLWSSLTGPSLMLQLCTRTAAEHERQQLLLSEHKY